MQQTTRKLWTQKNHIYGVIAVFEEIATSRMAHYTRPIPPVNRQHEKTPRSVELRGVFVFNPYGELNIKMNENDDKPININCKAEFGMKLITEAKLSEDGAKEVWSKVADNFRLPILLLAIGCLFALMCLGISLIKWW